jgi:hypothetical protein
MVCFFTPPRYCLDPPCLAVCLYNVRLSGHGNQVFWQALCNGPYMDVRLNAPEALVHHSCVNQHLKPSVPDRYGDNQECGPLAQVPNRASGEGRFPDALVEENHPQRDREIFGQDQPITPSENTDRQTFSGAADKHDTSEIGGDDQPNTPSDHTNRQPFPGPAE